MKFLALIHINEEEEAAYGVDDWRRLDAGYQVFAAEAQRRGVPFEGGALTPPSKATTVRVRGGRVLATDGPFADTKEGIGGYFVLDAASLDEAVALVALMPGAQDGAVEVRALDTQPGPPR